MKGTNWTADEDDTARAMWATGKSSGEIGKLLNRSRNSVIGRVHRLRLKAHGIVDPPRPLRNGKPRTKKGRGGGGALANKIASGTFGRRPPKAYISEPIPVYAGPPVNILDPALGHFHCRHIVSGTGVQTMFCAGPVPQGSAFSFCPVHSAIFTTKGSGRAWTPQQRASWFRSRATNARAAS